MLSQKIKGYRKIHSIGIVHYTKTLIVGLYPSPEWIKTKRMYKESKNKIKQNVFIQYLQWGLSPHSFSSFAKKSVDSAVKML